MRSTYIFLFFLFSLALGASPKKDSLILRLKQLDRSEKTLEWAKTKKMLGEEMRDAGQFADAVYQFEAAMEAAKELANLELIAESILGLAKSHHRLNNFSNALELYNKYLEYYSTVISNPKNAFVYSQLSDIYQNLGDNQKAFDLQIKALQLFEAAADTNGVASSTYSMASIFFYQQRYTEAQEKYEEAYRLGKVVNNGRLIYSCLAAIGSVYERKGNLKKSLYYNQESLKKAKSINYKYGIAYAYGNLGAIYLLGKDYKKAEHYYMKSLKMKESLGDKWGAIGGNFGLGRTYIAWGFPDQAIPILEVGLETAKAIDSKTRVLEGYQFMAEAYKAKDNKAIAFDYLSKYVALKDSILNEKTVEEMGQSKRRYEISKKEHEITLLKKENEIFEKQEQVQNLKSYFLLSAVLLLLVLSGWFFSRNKLQQEVNVLLEEKNTLLNTKSQEIQHKNEQLADSNESLTQFAYVASHDLKEPLRMIKSYTRLLEKKYTPLFDENAKEFMFYITDAVDRMTTLLDDLLEFSRAGNNKFTDDYLSFSDVMVIVQSNLKVQLAELNATMKVNIPDIPPIKANRTQLVQLIQNLVSNGVKFRGERDPVVTVRCENINDELVFSVKDNGIGISEENKSKVFEMFRRLHTREQYSGTGIGLATCKRIVDHYGGKIWVESTLGEGSTFFFTLPAATKEIALAEA